MQASPTVKKRKPLQDAHRELKNITSLLQSGSDFSQLEDRITELKRFLTASRNVLSKSLQRRKAILEELKNPTPTTDRTALQNEVADLNQKKVLIKKKLSELEELLQELANLEARFRPSVSAVQEEAAPMPREDETSAEVSYSVSAVQEEAAPMPREDETSAEVSDSVYTAKQIAKADHLFERFQGVLSAAKTPADLNKGPALWRKIYALKQAYSSLEKQLAQKISLLQQQIEQSERYRSLLQQILKLENESALRTDKTRLIAKIREIREGPGLDREQAAMIYVDCLALLNRRETEPDLIDVMTEAIGDQLHAFRREQSTLLAPLERATQELAAVHAHKERRSALSAEYKQKKLTLEAAAPRAASPLPSPSRSATPLLLSTPPVAVHPAAVEGSRVPVANTATNRPGAASTAQIATPTPRGGFLHAFLGCLTVLFCFLRPSFWRSNQVEPAPQTPARLQPVRQKADSTEVSGGTGRTSVTAVDTPAAQSARGRARTGSDQSTSSLYSVATPNFNGGWRPLPSGSPSPTAGAVQSRVA